MSHPRTIQLPAGHERDGVEVRLRDGSRASLRPLDHGETGPLLTVFEGMSDASRTLRYLTGLPRLPRQMLTVLSDVDGDRHASWLATVTGQPVGIARYVRLPGLPTTAELAFEVVDHHHGLGLGTVLLDTITTVASARGVHRIQATVAPTNTASRRLLARIGLRTRRVDGLLEAEGPLRLLDPAAVDRSAVVRLACAGPDEAALDIG